MGYGVKFRAAANSGWEGASEYQDVLAGGRYLAALPGVDASRVGAYGARQACVQNDGMAF